LNSKCVNRHLIDSITFWSPLLIKDSGKSEQYIPWKQRVVYYFSRPIFSNNGDFAVISGGNSCGGGCGEGCIYLFKKINKKWIEIGKASCYIK